MQLPRRTTTTPRSAARGRDPIYLVAGPCLWDLEDPRRFLRDEPAKHLRTMVDNEARTGATITPCGWDLPRETEENKIR